MCGSVSSLFDNNLFVFCLGEEHARDVLEGAICVHCELFSMKKLLSRLSLFSRKEGQPFASRESGPTAAEVRTRRALFSMLQSHLPSLSVPPSRQWSRSSGRRRCAQQLLKPSFQEGPGLSPKNAGVLACPGLRVGDGHRRLVSQLMHLPHLRVVLEGGMGQKEVGKT